MEQKLKTKLAEYLSEYKKNIHGWITANSAEMVNKQQIMNQTQILLKLTYSYAVKELTPLIDNYLMLFSGVELSSECSDYCNITNPVWCNNFMVGLK